MSEGQHIPYAASALPVPHARSVLVLAPHPDGTWTSTQGWTGKPDGKTVRFADCRVGRITFAGMAGKRIVAILPRR